MSFFVSAKPVARLLRASAIALVIGATLAIGLAARGESPSKPAAVTHDVPWLDGRWIRYSSNFAERSKIAFGNVEHGSLSPVIPVTGTVAFDPERVAAVGARIPGRIRRVFKFPGDHVMPGDPLAELESADLGEAQAALLSARAHEEAARANDQRQAELAEAGIASAKDAEAARALASAAKADVVAADQRIHAFGGIAGGEIGILLLRSPIQGKVIDLGISRGQSVEPSLTAVRVADLRRVWIELSLFERELGRIRTGDKVQISPQTNTAQVVEGTVAQVGDVIHLDTRSALVRVVVDNAEGTLRPGQSVLARIHVTGDRGDAMLLPREAIISIDGKSTVFVAHDDTSVEPRVVEIGSGDGAKLEVVTGLEPSDRVVVAGVFALKSEIFR